MKHWANLDVLRSCAVSCVVLAHLFLTLHTHIGFGAESHKHFAMALGQAGVLAFFVHTSLVLMYSLERTRGIGARVAVPFYLRRFFRIYPLAITAIVVVTILHIPWKTWDNPAPVGRDVVVANLLLVQNIFTKRQVLAPLWSLPYEVQMYIVLPPLFLLATRKKGPLYLTALLLAFCGLGVLIAIGTGHLNMAAYVPCFLSGVLCYSLRHRVRARIPALFWLPFLLILALAFLAANPGEEPSYWTGWIFCLVLGLAINAFRDSEVRSLNLAANKIALYSYGVYLVHVPVLYLLFLKWKVGALLGCCLYVVLTAILSVIAFHAIESPFIELGRRLSSATQREAKADAAVVVPAP